MYKDIGETLKALVYVANHEENWDGYNAAATSQECVEFVRGIIQVVYSKYNVCPDDVNAIPTGGIMLRYSNNTRDLDIDIGYNFLPDGNFSGNMMDIGYLTIDDRKDKVNRVFHEEDNISLAKMFELIESVVNANA